MKNVGLDHELSYTSARVAAFEPRSYTWPTAMSFGDDTSARFHALLGGLFLVLLSALSTWRAIDASVTNPRSSVPRPSAPLMRPDPSRLEALATRLGRRVNSGKLRLGHALLELNHAEQEQVDEQRAFDLADALTRYDKVLERARELAYDQRLGAVVGVVRALEENGFGAYNRVNARISDGLMQGAANCEGTTHLVVSLLTDLGLGDRVFIRVFANHVSPELVDGARSRHFGLTNGCPRPGLRVPPVELLGLYRVGRPDALGHFEYPASGTACADPGLLFDPEPPIVVHDESGRLWRKTARSPKGCAYPRPEMVRGSDQYEVRADSGSVLVERVVPSKERLAEYSRNIACTETLLETKLERDEDRLPFLGAAAGLYEQAAVLYAAAGLHSVVGELLRRQRRVVAEAEAILGGVDFESASGERLLRELSLRDSWPLKFLGDAGRDVLLRMTRQFDASYVLSVLVRDGATRDEALEIVRARPAAEQLEILGALDLENPWFFQEFSESPRARRLLDAHTALLSLAAHWKSCALNELITLTRAEALRARLAPNWVAPIVIRLGTHAVASRCPARGLADELLKFADSRAPTLAPHLRNELRLIRMMQ